MAKGSVTTALQPAEVIKRLDDTLRQMYRHARNHSASTGADRVNWSKLMASDLGVFEAFEAKLKDAFLRQLWKDGQSLYQKAREDPDSVPLVARFMKDVESILTEIKKHQWVSMQRAMYLRRLAKHLGREIGAEERELERQESRTKQLLERQLRKAERQKKGAEKTIQAVKTQQRKRKIPS